MKYGASFTLPLDEVEIKSVTKDQVLVKWSNVGFGFTLNGRVSDGFNDAIQGILKKNDVTHLGTLPDGVVAPVSISVHFRALPLSADPMVFTPAEASVRVP